MTNDLLPHSMEAEMGVLCALLMEPGTVAGICERAGLRPEHFWHPGHAEIYEAATYLLGERMPLDFVTLGGLLSSEKKMDGIGGAHYLTTLSTYLPTTLNAGAHVEIVLERAAARRMIVALGRWEKRLREPGVDAWAVIRAAGEELAAEKPTGGMEMDARLDACAFHQGRPPVEPVTLYSLAGQQLATPENLMVVQAKMKAGKSAAIGAMIASTMGGDGDCLGFASGNLAGRAVLHFDTEQSRYDHWRLIVRSLRRAKRETAPDWFRSHYLKGNPIAEMWAMVERAMEREAQRCGGIHSAFLDGVADFCRDVNDPGEACELVARIEALAMKYRTLMVCVIHENHASGDGKTRGHLGSHLARKAETNLRLEKNGEGTTLMFAESSRSVYISKKNAPGFAWSEEEECHVSALATPGAVAADRRLAELTVLAVRAFESVTEGKGYMELRADIMRMSGVSEATAGRRIGGMERASILEKRGGMYFIKSLPATIDGAERQAGTGA